MAGARDLDEEALGRDAAHEALGLVEDAHGLIQPKHGPQGIGQSGSRGKPVRVAAGDEVRGRNAVDQVGGGLKSDGELRGFEITGADGNFVPAKATIDGAQVVVSAEGVTDPKAVRYAWAAYPDGNLYNAEGLPATPFRTSKPTK